MARFATIDEYIASFPPDVQPVLQSVRVAIHEAGPGVDEGISYGIPAFRLDDRYLVYFAGWRTYVSLYPIPSGNAALTRDLARHASGKGTLRFRLDAPMPLELIGRVVAELLRQRNSGER